MPILLDTDLESLLENEKDSSLCKLLLLLGSDSVQAIYSPSSRCYHIEECGVQILLTPVLLVRVHFTRRFQRIILDCICLCDEGLLKFGGRF